MSDPSVAAVEPTARRRLHLMHTADLHLGYDLNPEAAALAFQATMAEARRSGVNLLLITGDLFDHHRLSDSTIEMALTGLRSAALPIVLLPGNHDSYDETSVYRRVDFERQVPGLRVVRKVEGELLRFPELTLTLWGKPVVVHEPSFRPLSGLPRRDDGTWHVALAHGLFVEQGPTHFSSPIFAEDLRELDWDYLALGHVHVPRGVSQGATPAHYSGSPAGVVPGGELGTVKVVTLDPAAGVCVATHELIDVGAAVPVDGGA